MMIITHKIQHETCKRVQIFTFQIIFNSLYSSVNVDR